MRNDFRLAPWLVLVLVLASACRVEEPPGFDAATLDTFATADGDGDGVPDGMDCDPVDPAVGATATRPCTHECGPGTEACTGGTWSACEPTVECRCAMEGARRTVACGNCGQAAEECLAGRWTMASACLNEGECAVAATETRMGARCSEEQRLCGDDCRWAAWSVIRPEGECEAGMRGTCVLSTIPGFPPPEDYVCSDECERLDDPCCPPTSPTPPGC